MKEIVIRAIIRKKNVFNTGYIHIKDELIEGIFTLDYMRMILDGKNMVLTLHEHSFYHNELLGFLHKSAISYYIQPYRFNTLYSPATYSLHDKDGSPLSLVLEEPIEDSDEVSQILKDINHVRV